MIELGISRLYNSSEYLGRQLHLGIINMAKCFILDLSYMLGTFPWCSGFSSTSICDNI